MKVALHADGPITGSSFENAGCIVSVLCRLLALQLGSNGRPSNTFSGTKPSDWCAQCFILCVGCVCLVDSFVRKSPSLQKSRFAGCMVSLLCRLLALHLGKYDSLATPCREPEQSDGYAFYPILCVRDTWLIDKLITGIVPSRGLDGCR